MLRVLRSISHRFTYLSSIDHTGMRRPRARAMNCLASVATLLVLALGWASTVRAQANVSLGYAGVIGALATNTSWSIVKNGSLAAGTASWTVGVTKVSVSHEIIEVDGQFRIFNTGTGPARLGNIIINLQRPCAAGWVSAAVDVADATFGQAATYGNFAAAASRENVVRNNPASSCNGPGNYVTTTPPYPGQTLKEGTLFTTLASGTVDFTNAADNSVFSLVPEFKLPAGTSIKLFYTATFDNTILGLAPGTPLRSEVIVSIRHAAPDVWHGMHLIDVDDDDGPAGQGVSLSGDDVGWSQSAATRQPIRAHAASVQSNHHA